MRILLINPPFNRLKGVKSTYFPMGLGYLAAILQKNGFKVGIYNAENSVERLSEASGAMLLRQHGRYSQALNDSEHYVWKEVNNTFSMFKPDVVGISVTTAKFGSAIKISDLCKKFDPDIKVVWGGAHPTIQAEEVLQNAEVDFAIRGEGELTIVELCRALADGAGTFNRIDGLSFKMDGKIIHNKPRRLIENLDELVSPAKDLSLYPKRYLKENMGDVVTSRGCPFECAFCGAQNIWGKKVRFRNLERVVNEIADISKKYNTKEFWFWDDSFTINRNRVLELCRRLDDEKLDISWGCTTRVDRVDDELLSRMKKAGCYMIEFGIESGSERMLKLIKKNITLDQVRKAVKLVKKHKIDLKAFFMMGFPEETREDIEQTKKLINEINPRGVVLSIFTPYPGSELYDKAADLGLIPPNADSSEFSHQSPENHFTKNIGKDDFLKIVTDQMKLVDQHNYSLAKAARHLKGRFFFYLGHPFILLRKTLSYLKRRLILQGEG